MQAPTVPLVETQLKNPAKEQSNIVLLHSVTEQSILEIQRMHTVSSLAADCNVSRDQAKYAYRKATRTLGELGKICEGTRYFSNDEKAKIVALGNFSDSTILSADEAKNHAADMEILMPGSVLARYRSGLAVHETTLPMKPDDNTGVVEFYVVETEKLGAQSIRFENLLSEAELKACVERGSERGALKALLERSAEQKSYQNGMSGTESSNFSKAKG